MDILKTIKTDTITLAIVDVNSETSYDYLQELKNIITQTGAVYLYTDNIQHLLGVENYNNKHRLFDYNSLIITNVSKMNYILYYTQGDRFEILRDYSKNIQEYIGLSRAEINRTLKHRKAEHFFYHSMTIWQWDLPTIETYNELIKIFNIDNYSGFISYDKLREIYNNSRYIHNIYPNHKCVFNETTKNDIINRLIKTSTNRNNMGKYLYNNNKYIII